MDYLSRKFYTVFDQGKGALGFALARQPNGARVYIYIYIYL